MTHFGFSDSKEGLKFYISSLKTDPKVKQIIHNSQVSLLMYSAGSSFPEDKEI
jgi:general stress protein 26